jgi:heptosyltransferase-2
VGDQQLRLGVSPEQEQEGTTLLARYGLERAGSSRSAHGYAVINPGAAFGAAKCWLPERFAEVCDRLHDQGGLRCAIVGAPGELPLMRRIADLAKTQPIVFDNPPTTLGTLKVVIRDAALLVCNDTGPRHYGNAFGVPTVTIFGPTHQEWTRTGYAGETRLQAKVECGPCQLPRCPLDHRCMTQVTSGMVLDSALARLTHKP